jgi:hypothetical protein
MVLFPYLTSMDRYGGKKLKRFQALGDQGKLGRFHRRLCTEQAHTPNRGGLRGYALIDYETAGRAAGSISGPDNRTESHNVQTFGL